MGIKRPAPFPYTLNQAVDKLLKEEFDYYRKRGEVPSLILENKIPASLFSNQELLNQWRTDAVGIRYYDEKLDAVLFGTLDDVLEFKNGKFAPLDYKTTGSDDPEIYDRFQLQMDVYTFLLEKNGFPTLRKGFLAFYVVDRNNGFKDRLPFKKKIVSIDTNPSDIPELFGDAVRLLRQKNLPTHSVDCKYGKWLNQILNYLNKM